MLGLHFNIVLSCLQCIKCQNLFAQRREVLVRHDKKQINRSLESRPFRVKAVSLTQPGLLYNRARADL